jgi:Ribbon-helix-helix protein, copG family
MTLAKKTHGKTKSGTPISDKLVAELNRKAEAGFDAEEIVRRRGGRPPLGSAPASVESVRLDPELREALLDRAHRDHRSTSAVIREALRRYLDVA